MEHIQPPTFNYTKASNLTIYTVNKWKMINMAIFQYNAKSEEIGFNNTLKTNAEYQMRDHKRNIN